MTSKKMTAALICGMLGCLCFGGGDWLMMYGDASYDTLYLNWLTEGIAQIPLWRFTLAMALAFPGIILYGIALFAVQNYIADEKHKKIYHYLNVFGLTPWLALHLYYIMILVLYSQLSLSTDSAYGNGEIKALCTMLFENTSWVIIVCEAFMLPVFVYWFYLQVTGRTSLPKAFAFTNVLLIFAVLKGVNMLMQDGAFSIAFRNGLMSESMIIWFGIMLVYELKTKKGGCVM